LQCFCDCKLVDAEDPAVAAMGPFGLPVYEGEDPSCYSRSKITEDELKDRVLGLLKNVPGMANVTGTFSAGKHPREVL